MTRRMIVLFTLCVVLGAAVSAQSTGDDSEPEIYETTSLSETILMRIDPSSFKQITYAGRSNQRMLDKRLERYVNNNSYYFRAEFWDDLAVDVYVNSEFGSRDSAAQEALRYATEAGRLPRVARLHFRTMWIHKGYGPLEVVGDALAIHVDHLEANYWGSYVVEELMLHEGGHFVQHLVDLDSWRRAQARDGAFISRYAKKHINEDIAESFVAYIAIRYRTKRLGLMTQRMIRERIPNRLEYFDSLGFEGLLCPIVIADCPEEMPGGAGSVN